ncbi:MAG TPA: thioredoxin-disulfide reductase [Oscillospiraceae bacterium]|nr:thioredoxin-disulfide reductase [Oscillospiraceae bacterium]HNW04316.1 thioredoxin-disulfide reductase [Oscillospiraceae bacterium]HPV99512.1 thioredoxin-disulfide reductase [Oscillospiraceae bacterium]
MYDILIIGAGTAGLTAAIYARRAGLSCAIFETAAPGGQIVSSPEVENYPGMPGMTGADYAMAIFQQAQDLGAEFLFSEVTGISALGTTKTVSTAKGDYQGRTIIVANGAQRRKLDVPGEREFTGRGVSYCATCDGNFFKGKDVAIVGAGNTAFEDAAYLAGVCRTVYLISRRNTFRASEILVNAFQKKENAKILANRKPLEIKGDKAVNTLILADTQSGETEELPVSAVFVAVGMEPKNGIFRGLKLDESGYIASGEDCKTNLPGVFTAGDTRTKRLRQLVTAASDGAVAATAAAQYLGEFQE